MTQPPDPSRESAESAESGAALSRSPLEPSELASDPRKLAAVLATVLDQQSRDAAANRAQARELIRALEGLAQSHEYLGKELQQERRRSKLLLAALIFVPLAVVVAGGLIAWTAWGTDARLETLRADVERDVRDLRSRDGSARIAGLRDDYEERLQAATGDVASLRTDLETTRAALDAERRSREEREAVNAARLAAADRDLAELAGLRAEARALRDLAGAEKARSDELARALAQAARAPLAAATHGADSDVAPATVPTPTATPPAKTSARDAPSAAVPRSKAPGAVAPAASSAAPAAPATPTDPVTATRDPADLDRIRETLNGLLDGGSGAARYQVERLEGVSGLDLLGAQVVGRDASGRTLRTVEAARLEITVSSEGGVRLRFVDGHLLVGGRKAPFFDGTYVITVEGSARSWRDSGLTCVRWN